MGKSDYNKDRKSSGKDNGGIKKRNFAGSGTPKPKNITPQKPSDPNAIRLNKYVANSGVCSRREADVFIAAGSVTVNGKVVSEMGYKVKLDDVVKFDGRHLNPEKKEYVLLNKPKDFSTTVRNEHGKRNVAGLISSASKSTLLPVDKMAKASTGLLLFTNDGELTKRLATPKNGIRKIYHIELTKPLQSADLKKIQNGVAIDENVVNVQDISYVDNAPKNQIGIELFSSRSNIVTKIFEHLGYEVAKLDRVIYGGLTKKDLPRGHWRYLTKQEVINLGMVK
tara:strand:+ start:1780 stop:2622 length:843 start_codon:yes stop_codon:yes gene_type:complete